MRVRRANTSPYQAKEFTHLEQELLERISGIKYTTDHAVSPEILITNTHTEINKIDLTNTQLIVHPNSGYDNFPYEFVTESQIPIIIGNSVRAPAVADYNMSCLMQHYSPLPKQPSWDPERKWDRKLISECKILLIGYGHVGKILSQSLNSLGASISIYDPFKESGALPQNLEIFDAIIVCASLNQTSRGMIDSSFLSRLKNDVLLINSSRGEIINQSALIDFLSSYSNAYAYLDVFETEPFKGEFKLSNLHTTSHIAGVYTNLDQQILQFEYQCINLFISLSKEDFVRKFSKDLLSNRVVNGTLI